MGEPWKKEQKSERQNTKTNARERETDIRKTLRIGVGERAELPSLRSERKSERANERERAAATGRRTKWVAADFLEIVGGLCAFISIWKMDFQWIAVFKPRISLFFFHILEPECQDSSLYPSNDFSSSYSAASSFFYIPEAAIGIGLESSTLATHTEMPEKLSFFTRIFPRPCVCFSVCACVWLY